MLCVSSISCSSRCTWERRSFCSSGNSTAQVLLQKSGPYSHCSTILCTHSASLLDLSSFSCASCFSLSSLSWASFLSYSDRVMQVTLRIQSIMMYVCVCVCEHTLSCLSFSSIIALSSGVGPASMHTIHCYDHTTSHIGLGSSCVYYRGVNINNYYVP